MNESKSIARAVWQKEQKLKDGSKEDTASTAAVASEDNKNLVTDEVVSEAPSRADTDVSSRSGRSSHSNLRNTIIYGLPHITLVPPTS